MFVPFDGENANADENHLRSDLLRESVKVHGSKFLVGLYRCVGISFIWAGEKEERAFKCEARLTSPPQMSARSSFHVSVENYAAASLYGRPLGMPGLQRGVHIMAPGETRPRLNKERLRSIRVGMVGARSSLAAPAS